MLHAGDGNLHPHLLFDAGEPGIFERVPAAGEELIRMAIDPGGALRGEHGIGLEKRAFMPLVFRPTTSRHRPACAPRSTPTRG